MNQHALVIVGRANPETPGRSPFSPVGTGFCVHPDGVVATCWHTVAGLLRRYSTIDVPRRGGSAVTWHKFERHEVPAFSFLQGVGQPGEAVVHWMLSGEGNVDEDISLVELGGGRKAGPLPAVTTAEEAPRLGEFVHFIGHHQPAGAPVDPDGQIGGFALTYQGGTVVAADDSGFCLDYAIPRGMSGAPVFRPEDGRVIGMIVETWPSELAASRIGISAEVTRAVAIGRVMSFLPTLREHANARALRGGRPWCGLIP